MDGLSGIGRQRGAEAVESAILRVVGGVEVEESIVGGVGIVGSGGHQDAVVHRVDARGAHVPEETHAEGGVGRQVDGLGDNPLRHRVGDTTRGHGLGVVAIVCRGCPVAALGFVPAGNAFGEGLHPRQGVGGQTIDNPYGAASGVTAVTVGDRYADGVVQSRDAGAVGHPGAVAGGVGGKGATHLRLPVVAEAGVETTQLLGDKEGGAVGGGLLLCREDNHRHRVVVHAYAVHQRLGVGSVAAVVQQPHADSLSGVGHQRDGTAAHGHLPAVEGIDGVGITLFGLHDSHQAVEMLHPQREVLLQYSGHRDGRREHVVPPRGGPHEIVLAATGRRVAVLLVEAIAVVVGQTVVADNLPAGVVAGDAAGLHKILVPGEHVDGVASVHSEALLQRERAMGVAGRGRQCLAAREGIDDRNHRIDSSDRGVEEGTMPAVAYAVALRQV